MQETPRVIVTSQSLGRVLSNIRRERLNQENKWGEQNHPDGTGPEVVWTFTGPANYVRDCAREACDTEHREGHGTWRSIAVEELSEAIAEKDPVELRRELIQAAAVLVAWIECIDRR